MLEFFDKYKVIYSVERFSEINKKTTDELVGFKESGYVMETESQCNCRAASWPERELITDIHGFKSRTQPPLGYKFFGHATKN